jgi:Ser/Thr protein kinase RdoA (MazF antagonist)
VQVERLTALARAALPAWGMDGARLELIKYRENAVFAVTAPGGGRRVLRVHRPRYRSDAMIRSEAAWMRALSEAGAVPTPALLPTRGGDLVTLAAGPGVPEPRQCDLMTWVAGAPLGTLEQGVDLGDEALRRTYRTVGAIAARIHEHAASWKRPPAFERPAWDAATLIGDAPTFGRFEDLPEIDSAQRRTLVAARGRARRALAELGPAGALVHGDLIPDNLLVDGPEVRVIDFDDCGWSWLGFEFATSLFPLLASGGFDAGREALLRGYGSVRALPAREIEALPHFLVARALSYLGWPAGRPEIAAARKMVPWFAGFVTDLCERYLRDAL